MNEERNGKCCQQSIILGKDTDLLKENYFHFDLNSNDIYFKSMRTSSTAMKIWDIRKRA
jgi:hypothetical protein